MQYRFGTMLTLAAVLGHAEVGDASAGDGVAPPSFPTIRCNAEQTGGFHDYPGEGEHYEPALFHPSTFVLEENVVFMRNLDLGNGGPDLYLVMRAQDSTESELQCRQVRGADNALGYSCVNTPPSEMVLINGETLRFTRTAVGGWTFSGARESLSGDSIFVEYGSCTPLEGEPAARIPG